ncbi:MAG TPA: DUF418 domain-containing protein [Thermoanaerobaculia bacterium]|nr:DUF418 domain-containing protein [Thermoanaerobaculia bacterium]
MTIEPAEAPAPVLQPVASSERVELIDVVRGLALFGILAANIRGFAGPAVTYYAMPHLYWPALHDRIAQAFIDTFIQAKFITIFAFLFGVGFAVQLQRATGRGGRFGWTFARRLFVLALFGLVHGLLIWFGDILLVYALTGFVLLLFRKRTDKTIAVWALVCYLLLPLAGIAGYVAWTHGFATPSFPQPEQAELLRLTRVFGDGSWMEIQKQRMSDVVAYNWGYFLVFFWQILGLFLLGVLAWRKRFFTPAPESLPRYRRAMVWGLAAGVTGNIAVTALRWAFDPRPFPSTPISLTLALTQTIAVPMLSLGYVCLAIVLMHDPAWHARLRRFGYVGRTALTNYLLQSILGTLIFYSYGLGLFGTVGPSVLIVATVVIFALQVYASGCWLERFRFGPVEWLWRRLTYKGPLPMVREAPVATADAAPA